MSKLEKHIQQMYELQAQYTSDQITWDRINQLINRLKKLRPTPKSKTPIL